MVKGMMFGLSSALVGAAIGVIIMLCFGLIPLSGFEEINESPASDAASWTELYNTNATGMQTIPSIANYKEMMIQIRTSNAPDARLLHSIIIPLSDGDSVPTGPIEMKIIQLDESSIYVYDLSISIVSATQISINTNLEYNEYFYLLVR